MSSIRLFLIYILLPLSVTLLSDCTQPEQASSQAPSEDKVDTVIFTPYSSLPNKYRAFHSPRAINRLAEMENEYFRAYPSGLSRYYGTVWREHAEAGVENWYERYRSQLGEKGDSMHCTIYAVEALKAGLGEGFENLEQSHRRIWNQREHAGWSIGYLLVTEWDWQAYLVLDSTSEEFDHCLRAFRRNSSYPVWRQPDIPLEACLIRGKDDAHIQALLAENEFGWGFSRQGIHTWITRFEELKECNWMGAPGEEYEFSSAPLFLKTPFMEYEDYASHVLIFPPRSTAD